MTHQEILNEIYEQALNETAKSDYTTDLHTKYIRAYLKTQKSCII